MGSGYWAQMVEGRESCQPEVESSQSDKRLQSYGWLKFSYLKTKIYISQALKSLKFSGGGPPGPPYPTSKQVFMIVLGKSTHTHLPIDPVATTYCK